MKSFKRIGLALKGGCREGAYQAGVVCALAERGLEVSVVSGVGIGGLNAGIISCAPDTKTAALRLSEVWEELAVSLEREADIPVFLQYTLSAGHTLRYSSTLLRLLKRIAKRCQVNLGVDTQTGKLEDTVLGELLQRYLDEEALVNGKPLYAVSFKTTSYAHALGVSAMALAKIGATQAPHPVLIQSVNRTVMKSFLLSTVSTPVLFKTFCYHGGYHFDGRIGGSKMGIVHPLYTSLLQHQCDLIIAPHCQEVFKHEEVTFLTLNPLKPMARSFGLTGPLKDYLGLTPNMITTWKDQGYFDTLAILDKEEVKGVLTDEVSDATPPALYYQAVQTLESEMSGENAKKG